MKNIILIIAIIAIGLVSFSGNKKITKMFIAKSEIELMAYIKSCDTKGYNVVSVVPYLVSFTDKSPGNNSNCTGIYKNNFIIKVEY